ncbi:cytochrome P450 6k1 [Anabrus simplex]|uniref:cytochrome P450 6k1 n=1 Tax=Anabrus simplex TaxID=316456 RepID=UPI0035A2E5C5
MQTVCDKITEVSLRSAVSVLSQCDTHLFFCALIFSLQMLLTFFLVAILVTPTLYLYCTWTFDYWKKKGVPFIKPLPLFGNVLAVITRQKTPVDLWVDLYRAGDGHPFLGLYHFRSPSLLVRDPEMIKNILVTNFNCFNRTAMKVDRKLDPLLARHPFVLSGDVWRAVRSLLVPAFTLYKVKNQFPLMAMECREMIQYLENEAPKHRPDGLNVRQMTRKFAVDVVVRCGFGIIGNSFHESEGVLRKFGEDFTAINLWKGIRILMLTLIPKLPKFLTARFMNLDGQEFFRQLIRELIRYRENNRVFRNDYLQMLMHIKYMGKNVKGINTIRVAGVNIEFTDDDIAAHALMFFFTGTEISSFILAHVLYELARNTEIQTQLREEIDSVLKRHSGGLTYEAIEEMFYMDMVLNETLRKYPPFAVLLRTCTRPCELPLPNGKTFIMDEGVTAVISTLALHMDPNNFPEPEKFDPERFSAERKDSIKPYTFLPFGEGPRQCFAYKFAQAEIKAGIVAVVSHFEIRTTPRTPVILIREPFGFPMDVKGGLWLDFVRRK